MYRVNVLLSNFLFLLALLLPLQTVSAQQYAGEVIPGGLPPSIGGAELSFWNIVDKKSRNVTLVNYSSLNSSGQRLSNTKVQRVIVIIHGLNRDPLNYIWGVQGALNDVSKSGSGPSADNVQIIAPFFPNGDDKGNVYPWIDGLAPGKGSNTSCLVWHGADWSQAENNVYPSNKIATSSFDVLDQILTYYDNKAMFPNVNQIVVAGHSLGAQMVQRYAAVGKTLGLATRVNYWIGNPDSYVWFNADRPVSTGSCTNYNDWRDGLDNYTPTYGSTLVASGPAAVLSRYNSRSINYARGLQDMVDDSSRCGPDTTGANHQERFYNFIKAFPPACTSASSTSCKTVDLIDCAHDFGCMVNSAAGKSRFFLDNWSGSKSRAFDFGCPRLVQGDDPWPNTTCQSTASSPSVPYSGMSYAGCFADSSDGPSAGRILPYQAFSNSTNTIETCTAACSSASYSLAGLSASYINNILQGYDCLCGNSLGYQARLVGEQACLTPCAGNSSQKCGGYGRYSVFSTSGNATIKTTPVVPPVIQNYIYQGCYNESIVQSRALTAASFSNTTGMTNELCATYCAGYAYFGTEFKEQCFCGSKLPADVGLNSNTSCLMQCPGNENEYCGGNARLTLFKYNGTIVDPLSCPNDDSKNYTTSAGTNYTIQCGIDHAGGDIASTSVRSIENCLSKCEALSGCIAVTYAGGNCYMKGSVGYPNKNGGAIGAVLASALTSSSTTTTSTKSSLTTASTATASVSDSNMCPGVDNQIVVGSQNNYTIRCSSDTSVGSFSSAQVSDSYLDCFAACDNTAGCVAFTYVGGNNGLGSATCWLKNSRGNATPAGVNFVAGFLSSQSSTVVSSSSSTSVASTSTASALAPWATNSAGSNYTIAYSSDSTQGAYSNAAASTNFIDCMNACDADAQCNAFTYVGGKNGAGSGTCWKKTALGSLSPSGNNVLSGSRVSKFSSVSSVSSSSAPTSSSSSAPSSSAPAISSSPSSAIPSSSGSIAASSSSSTTSSLTSSVSISAGLSSFYYSISSDTPSSSGATSSSATLSATASSPVASSSSTASVTQTSPASSAYTSGARPVFGGVTYSIQVNTSYSGTRIRLPRKRATTFIDDCLNVCASSTSCVASAFDDGAASCSYYSDFDNTTMTTAPGITFAIVQSRDASDLATPSSSSNSVTSLSSSTLGASSTSTLSTFTSSTGSSPSDSVSSGTTSTSSSSIGSIRSSSTVSSTSSASSTTDGSSSRSATTSASSTDSSTSATLIASASSSSSSSASAAASSTSSEISSVSSTSSVSSSSTSTTLSSNTASSSAQTSSSLSSSVVVSSSSTSVLSSNIVSTGTTSATMTSSSTIASSSTLSSSSATTSSSTTTSSSLRSSSSPSGTLSSSISTASSPPLPTGFVVYNQSCYVDSGARVLPKLAYSNSSNTPALCATACRTLGYPYSGTEWSSECWCGKTAPTNPASSISVCNSKCAGDSTLKCGGGSLISVVFDTMATPFVARAGYGNYTLQSCYSDGGSSRTLLNSVAASNDMTVTKCLTACKARGFVYCGLEWSSECWGQASKPDAGKLLTGDVLANGCGSPCAGNSTEACGGSNRVLVYADLISAS
ncbi:hypothetical protein E4T47_09141 [Aureobasidium subglaciale]|nr:hypothetical protein E4T47_09141 [Aureobasidium subglaciale]